MLFTVLEMLKKRLGIDAIERNWENNCINDYFKLPSTLIIPEGCWWIGYRAFWGCVRLEKVVISKSVKDIGSFAFYGCKNARVFIKNKNTTMGVCVFADCRDVKEKIRA